MAILCSVVVISILVFAMAPLLNYFLVPDDYAFQDQFSVGVSAIFMLIFTMSLLVLVMSILPCLAIVYVAESQRKQRKIWFILAGMALSGGWLLVANIIGFDGIFSEMIYGDAAIEGTQQMKYAVDVLALACGVFGGYIYWAIAGRYSGSWKSIQ
jgi:hypothetical protein